MDWINDRLAVSNAQFAREYGDEFDRVISLASPHKNTTEEDDFLIKDGDHSYKKFRKATDTVIEALEQDEDVLVHCMAGISRSVSVCIAACCLYENITYDEAYQKCQRGFQHPNPELLDSTRKYISENKD
jgi:protein-tyrosine phosphatase